MAERQLGLESADSELHPLTSTRAGRAGPHYSQCKRWVVAPLFEGKETEKQGYEITCSGSQN